MAVHPTKYLADFDSATAMLRALANYLRGKDFPMLGAMPRWTKPGMWLAAGAVNALPDWLREQIYIWSGWYEAIDPGKLSVVNGDEVAEWMVSLYPKRTYSAVMIGSANGATVHLCAALGIPWLPQAFLVPVARSGVHPDEPSQDMAWAKPSARVVLEYNPDLQLHHMHDPVQDRLMIQRMSYFRLKRLRLGVAYARFLRESLEPGGTIAIQDCRLKWPTTRSGDRYLFQFGALGGATVDELLHGGPRVTEYLSRHRSHRRQWQSPPPDSQSPEAEWGFEPAFGEDVERFAQEHGYRVKQIAFDEPEHMSPLVADFYRWWNEQRGVRGRRLLVESFIVMEPYWTVRTGSAPFWIVFNKEKSLQALESYLQTSTSFDEIFLMLFSHGVNSIGLIPIEQWCHTVQRAAKRSVLVGVDEEAFPRDFAVFARYSAALQRAIRGRYSIPPPLTLRQWETFLDEHKGCYQVQWV